MKSILRDDNWRLGIEEIFFQQFKNNKLKNQKAFFSYFYTGVKKK